MTNNIVLIFFPIVRSLHLDPPILYSDYPIPEAEICSHAEVEGLSVEAYCEYISHYIKTNVGSTLCPTPTEQQGVERETAAGIFYRLKKTRHQKIKEAAVPVKKIAHAQPKPSEVIVATARQVLRQLGEGGRLKCSGDNGEILI